MKSFVLLLCCIILTSFLSDARASGQGKMVMGWLEKARIFPGNFLLRAKLDTGAKTCSLTALSRSEFTRNGEQWVRFEVKDKYAAKIAIERKVLRTVSVKRLGQELQKRPVVLLGICLGYIYKEIEVSLVDRTGFNYPMLLGRNFLGGNFLVDPSAKFTVPPSCVEVLQP
jgi:hypothetical protein